MSIKFLKLSVFSLFLVSGSLMAQMTTYETIQDNKNLGYYDAYTRVDSWSKNVVVEGYNIHVEVNSYGDGSTTVEVPDKVMNGMNYITVDGCTYSEESKEVKCHYEIYNYVKTVVEKEATYFDVVFYRDVYRDVYEKKIGGFLNIKRP